jgi:hypothetical protein
MGADQFIYRFPRKTDTRSTQGYDILPVHCYRRNERYSTVLRPEEKVTSR